MLHPTPESFRKDLESLSQQLQALRDEFRQRDLLSDAHKAIVELLQRHKERLAAKLAEAESKRANWDTIKGEFRGAWNSFVADLEMLKLRLMDAESAQDTKAKRSTSDANRASEPV
jgi:chromosome segregation ATPase